MKTDKKQTLNEGVQALDDGDLTEVAGGVGAAAPNGNREYKHRYTCLSCGKVYNDVSTQPSRCICGGYNFHHVTYVAKSGL